MWGFTLGHNLAQLVVAELHKLCNSGNDVSHALAFMLPRTRDGNATIIRQ